MAGIRFIGLVMMLEYMKFKTVFFALLIFAAVWLLLVPTLLPPAYKSLAAEFNTDSVQRDLCLLLEKAEMANRAAALPQLGASWAGTNLKVCRVPKNILPDELKTKWGHAADTDRIKANDVLAFIDGNKIVAVYFTSSRAGCFVSLNPMLCPPSFNKLIRISSYPVFITVADCALEEN